MTGVQYDDARRAVFFVHPTASKTENKEPMLIYYLDTGGTGSTES